MKLKLGDLVQVISGEDKGLIGRIRKITMCETDHGTDTGFSVVRLHKDINAGLLPETGEYKREQLIKIYTDEELRYSATCRCECGARMAYAKHEDLVDVSCWECSDILTGRALIKDPKCKNTHSCYLENKTKTRSEDQSSAHGLTTRPKEDLYKKESRKMVEVKHDLLTNNYTRVFHEDKGKFNAPNHFIVTKTDSEKIVAKVDFQEGPCKEVGVNGAGNEDVLIMVLTRLKSFQDSEFRCEENAMAITKLEEALLWLRKRTMSREKRGVVGTFVK